MLMKFLENKSDFVVISTGNVLGVNKKAGQKATEELIDCLKITLNEGIFNTDTSEIIRSNDNLHDKIIEHDRSNIKIGAKVFLNHNSIEYLNEAVITLLKILNVNCIDNIVLSRNMGNNINPELLQNSGNNFTEIKDVALDLSTASKQSIDTLKTLWKALEKYAEEKTVCQLGISDVDADTLKRLYESCKIHPTITQISLAACCVVPPPLQEFCNKNDIQLLTHSDPEDILSEDSLTDLGLVNYKPKWTVRYQIHVKCRGLLTAKGFIVAARRETINT